MISISRSAVRFLPSPKLVQPSPVVVSSFPLPRDKYTSVAAFGSAAAFGVTALAAAAAALGVRKTSSPLQRQASRRTFSATAVTAAIAKPGAGSMAPLIAFIADTSNANGKALMQLLPELDGKAECIVGNDLESFKASSKLADVDVIIPVVFAGGNPALISDLWPLCPKTRWVHSMAAGVDTVVPLMNALPRGPETPLTNAKGAFSRSLAEYGLTAMLHFNKQIPRLQANRLSKTWDRFTMGELYGMTAGFIGYGDIAQANARLCRAFGMHVLAFRQTKGLGGESDANEVFYGEESGAAGKLEVFKRSDFVVCSLPGGAATRHACGAAEFAVMKPGSVFISMGRGTCVDEVALVEALKNGPMAGAALDVFDKEPLPQDSPLWSCENLLLSPHNADLTQAYMRQSWSVFLDRLAEFTAPDFRGFKGTVDMAKGY